MCVSIERIAMSKNSSIIAFELEICLTTRVTVFRILS